LWRQRFLRKNFQRPPRLPAAHDWLVIRKSRNSITHVSTEPGTRAVRYETIIATLVGVSALFVSGYTAYVQRQQVRAAVWPILEFSTSNEPVIRFTLANKGVGPAIIRHVAVTVDGQPARNWPEILQKLLGPGAHRMSQTTIHGRVLAAGETVEVLIPHDDENHPLAFEKGGPLFTALDNERRRIAVDICYCSTLGECWTLHSGSDGSSTTETRTCPDSSATAFEQ
jgi:hypothetical protein